MLALQRVCLGANSELIDDEAQDNPELTADQDHKYAKNVRNESSISG